MSKSKIIMIAISILTVIALLIGVYALGKHSGRLDKLQEIEKELKDAKALAAKHKEDAETLARSILELNRKKLAIQERAGKVKAPASDKERTERLKALGLKPEVKCE